MISNPLLAVLPPDQADLILIMILSIPLSYALSKIRNKIALIAFSGFFTILFQCILFPLEKHYLWIQQQVVYLIILLVPRKIVGHFIIIQSFIALILLQWRRMSIAYGQNQMDVTAIFLMQLFNWVGLGYNYQNGMKDISQLSADQIKRRIVDRPNYLTYMSYVNFMPACLVGPVYEYVDYHHYIHKTGDYENTPDTLKPLGKEMITFLISLVLYGATSMFPLSIVTTPEFLTYSFPYTLLYCVLTITHIELKYVSAWSLGMASMRASGFTYNPDANVKKEDGKIQYNFGKVQVNNMQKFYLEPTIKVKTDNWNISVAWALRRYIYENIYDSKAITDEAEKKKKQASAQLYTVLVSALWHGLYLGYFISFIHWILYVQITQEIFRIRKQAGTTLHKIYQSHPKIFDIVQNLLATFVLTYFGMAFHLMIWERIVIYLSHSYYIPYILLYISFILIVVLRVLSPKKKKEKKEGKQVKEN